MATFIHTADTHLGYRQYHRPERADDFMEAFSQVIDEAIDRDVDAVIHAGDFFHDSRPSTSTIQAALTLLRRLAENDIDFLAVVGNHEGTQGAQWLDIFSELGLAVHLGGGQPYKVKNTAVYGLDHIPESRQNQISLDFEPSDAAYSVLVMHGLVDPVSSFGTWNAEHILGQSPVQFDAVLLGDDHKPEIEWINGTVFSYPGSTERTAIDQQKQRVFNIVKTGAKDTDTAIQQVELDTRKHQFVHLELEEGEGNERIKRELEEHELEGAVVGIIIEGQGRDITPAAIEEYGKQQGALVVRVSDRRKFDHEDVDLEVSFSDPDAAVQERIRDMGLSVAAYNIEQRVRDITGYPKSTITDMVESYAAERIDEGIDDFETAANIEEPEEPQGLERFSRGTPEESAESASPEEPEIEAGEPNTTTETDDQSDDREKSSQVSIDEYQT